MKNNRKYNILLLGDRAQGFEGSTKGKGACSFGDITEMRELYTVAKILSRMWNTKEDLLDEINVFTKDI